MALRVSARSLVLTAIWLIVYLGLQGAIYFLANRLQEIGILLCLILFFYSGILSAYNVKEKDFNWNLWFIGPLAFLIYIMVIPSVFWGLNAKVAILPSVAASRAWIFVLFGPALYMLYRSGLEIKHIEKVVISALVALVLSYLFHYLRMDLRAAYYSTDYTVNSLITFDPWRGYRLKAPLAAIFLLSILAPAMLVKAKSASQRLGWAVLVGILVYIWMLLQARSAAATLILGTFLYHFCFARKIRLGLFFMILPLAIVGAWYGTVTAMESLSKLDPEFDGVRYKSFGIAWEVLMEHPFFGYGQQSYSTVTEQDLFWYKFFSADIGLHGVGFKYGFIGIGLYLYYSVASLSRLITANWRYKETFGTINPIFVTIIIVFLSYTVNIAIGAFLSKQQGFIILSYAYGATAAWQHYISSHPSPSSSY